MTVKRITGSFVNSMGLKSSFLLTDVCEDCSNTRTFSNIELDDIGHVLFKWQWGGLIFCGSNSCLIQEF